VAQGIGGAPQQATAGAVILYFSSLGFFAGYVLTRMFFSEAFSRSDRNLNVPSDEDTATLGPSNTSFMPFEDKSAPDAAMERAAQRMRDVPLSNELTAQQALAVANGALLTQDTSRAVSAARLAASMPGASVEAQLAYAYALYQARAHPSTLWDQLERTHAALIAAPDGDTKEDIYNSLVYIALYLDPRPLQQGDRMGRGIHRPPQARKKSLGPTSPALRAAVHLPGPSAWRREATRSANEAQIEATTQAVFTASERRCRWIQARSSACKSSRAGALASTATSPTSPPGAPKSDSSSSSATELTPRRTAADAGRFCARAGSAGAARWRCGYRAAANRSRPVGLDPCGALRATWREPVT